MQSSAMQTLKVRRYMQVINLKFIIKSYDMTDQFQAFNKDE